MALMEMTFCSEALNSDQTVTVFLPEPKDLKLAQAGKPYTENLPVLYLLHGHTDNHTAWLRRSNMEAYLHHSDLNMICVCPGMQNFWYTDMANGWAYYTFMAVELPNFIETVFRASGKREDRFIAGLSMGGYGAMQIALKNPDRYAAVASFSGGVDIVDHLLVGDGPDAVSEMEIEAVFGVKKTEDLKGTDADLFHVVDQVVESGKTLPKMYVSCGTADELTYPAHLAFCKHLKEKGVEFTEFEQEGMAHEWDFWDSEGRKLIDWLPVQQG